MNVRFASAFAAILLIACTSCGGNTSNPPISVGSADHLYVANSADGTISAFTVSATGALAAVPGGPVATALIRPTGLTGASSGVLYAGSSVGKEITTFSVDLKTGQLSDARPLPSAFMTIPSWANAANLQTCGNRLYAFGLGYGPRGTTGWSGFAYLANSDGSFSTAEWAGFGLFDADPVVSNGVLDSSCLFVFHANTAGNLAVMSGFDAAAHSVSSWSWGEVPAGSAPVWVATDSGTKFLYVANSGSNDVSAYVIDIAAKTLTPVPDSPFAAGLQPSSVLVIQSWVYVTNAGDNTVSAYSLDANTGALTPVSGSPFAVGSKPVSLVSARTDLSHSPTGTLLYVANENSNNISAFVVKSDGSLQAVPGSPFAVGNGPKAMTVLVGPQ